MKIKKIGAFEVDVFKHAVYVYIGMPDGVPLNAQAHCSMPVGSQHIELYIRDKKAFQGYVMHECVHAADFILDNIGAYMGTDANSSEIRAYLAEYIFCKTECVLGRMKETSLYKAIKNIKKENK